MGPTYVQRQVKLQQSSREDEILSITVEATRVITCNGLKIRANTVEQKASAAIPEATTVSDAASLNDELVVAQSSEFGATKVKASAQGARTMEMARFKSALIIKPKV